MRTVLRILFAIVGAVALAIAAGMLVPLSGAERAERTNEAGRLVFLQASAIHTDIALPIDADLRERFAFLEADGLPLDDPRARYLLIGRGGREFYLNTPTWGDLRAGPLFSALTIDDAAIHAELASSGIETAPDAIFFDLSAEEYEALVAAILQDFTRDSEGAPLLIEGGAYGPFDLFYEAPGWFNAIIGCNIWTADKLRAAGVTTGAWTPLPVFLRLSLRLHNDRATAEPR